VSISFRDGYRLHRSFDRSRVPVSDLADLRNEDSVPALFYPELLRAGETIPPALSLESGKAALVSEEVDECDGEPTHGRLETLRRHLFQKFVFFLERREHVYHVVLEDELPVLGILVDIETKEVIVDEATAPGSLLEHHGLLRRRFETVDIRNVR